MTVKKHTDGTHRAIAPAQTIKTAEPFLAAMGITRVANVTGLDRLGIPVVNAYRPNSRSLSVSQGKGRDLKSAKASAIMEAIEGFHAEEVDLPVKRGSFNEMVHDHRLIDIEGLPFLRDTRFHPDRPALWIEGHDLLSSQSVWMPFELVHTDYTLARPPGAGCFVASTNGLASGNHPIEAIIHGICEVIERDAHTLWHLSSDVYKAGARVDLATVSDASCQALIKTLEESSMTVGVWDMTSDTDVATFYCLILDSQSGGHSGAGAGTHLDAGVALSRALTEAVQVRTNYITGARDDLEHAEYERIGIATKARYANSLFNAEAAYQVDFQSVTSRLFESFEDDLDWLLTRLASVGIDEVISVDLTKHEFGIPVFRIIIPGLEGPHDHDDYCPGNRARRQVKRIGA